MRVQDSNRMLEEDPRNVFDEALLGPQTGSAYMPPSASAPPPPPTVVPAGYVYGFPQEFASGNEVGWQSKSASCCKPRPPICTSLLSGVAVVLGIVTASGGGSVYWIGWQANHTLYRCTLQRVNSCGADAGDTFCSDFFADNSLRIGSLPGGARLLTAGYIVQGVFSVVVLGAFGAFLTEVVRFCYCCRCCRGCTVACPSPFEAGDCDCCCPCKLDGDEAKDLCGGETARFFGIRAVIAFLSAAAAGLALSEYAAAAAAFTTAQQPPISGWALMGGFGTGTAAATCLLLGGLLCMVVFGVNARRWRRWRRDLPVAPPGDSGSQAAQAHKDHWQPGEMHTTTGQPSMTGMVSDYFVTGAPSHRFMGGYDASSIVGGAALSVPLSVTVAPGAAPAPRSQHSDGPNLFAL